MCIVAVLEKQELEEAARRAVKAGGDLVTDEELDSDSEDKLQEAVAALRTLEAFEVRVCSPGWLRCQQQRNSRGCCPA